MSLFSNKVTGLRTAPKDSFCLTQRRIQNLLKHLRWSFFKNNLFGIWKHFYFTVFCTRNILWQPKYKKSQPNTRSSHRRCSVRKGVLRNFATLLKKRLWHLRFPVNFAKFLRTPFSQSTFGRLLLKYISVNVTSGNISVKHRLQNVIVKLLLLPSWPLFV